MSLEKVYDLGENARGFAYVCENPSCLARGPIGKIPEEAYEKAYSLTNVSIKNIIRQIQTLSPGYDHGIIRDEYGRIMWQKGCE